MATLLKIFIYTSSSEGWQFPTPANGLTLSWNNSSATPPSALKVDFSPSGSPPGVPSNASGYMWWQGTWEDLGVPAGSTVTQVQVTSLKTQVTTLSSSLGSLTMGPVEFYQQGGSLQATLLSERTVTTVDSDWNTSGSGTAASVASGLQPSNSNIEFRIRNSTSVNSGSSPNTGYYDDLNILVTYSAGTITGSATLSVHANLNASGTFQEIDSTSGLSVSHPTLRASGTFVGPPTTTITNSCPLYISTGTLSNKPMGLNLSINGEIEGLQTDFTGYSLQFRPVMSPTLYIKGVAATLVENTTPLIITGFAASLNSHLNLYIEQHGGSSTIPLFVNGLAITEDASDFVNLYIDGYSRLTNTLPLTVYMGSLAGNSIPLYVAGPGPTVSSIPLYLHSPLGFGHGLNLFLKGDNIPRLLGNIPLIIQGGSGGTTPRSVNATTLFMLPSPPLNESLNLFINGIVGQHASFSNLNLVMQSEAPQIVSSIPLFVMNGQAEIFGYSDLYIRGLGTNAGYSPSESFVNLSLTGFGSGSFVSAISQNSFINLIINGDVNAINSYNNIIPLFVSAPAGNPINSNSTLFVSGANPPGINANIPLVIYKTSFVKIVPLYIHGF